MKYLIITISSFLLSIPFLGYASNSLVITEIMYNPDGGDAKREWVEVQNVSNQTIGLQDWRINDGSNHQIKNDMHPEYLTIFPGEIVILASDIDAFIKNHPSFSGKILDTVLNLKNSEGKISLIDENKNVVYETTYHSSTGGNGNGKTLEWKDVESKFTESQMAGGTPGTRISHPSSTKKEINEPASPPQERTRVTTSTSSSTPPAPEFGVLISEFLPNPAQNQGEWIELYNANSSTAHLAGWKLKDKSEKEYVMHDTTLEPNTFLFIAQNDSNIYINNDGDELSLLNARGGLVSKITFQGKAPKGQSFARKSENDWGWTTKPTPGKENVFVAPEVNKTALLENTIITPETLASDYSKISTQKSTNPVVLTLLSLGVGLMFTIITILLIKTFL